MTPIVIHAGSQEYEALVDAQLLEKIGALLAQKFRGGPRCAVVSDENVAPLFGQQVMRSLTEAGFRPVLITVPAGEESKSLRQAEKVCDQMIAAGLDRSSLIIALGGGVVGDLAGFVAAIYHRGIPYVQVPTTLLAQVDSSIGGKVAVNHPRGKNLIGTFHPPFGLNIFVVQALTRAPVAAIYLGVIPFVFLAIVALVIVTYVPWFSLYLTRFV